jgi:DNA-binding NarL/FixJ family response regulator
MRRKVHYRYLRIASSAIATYISTVAASRASAGVGKVMPGILVVDDHEVVRKGVIGLLQTRWDICGEASNGQEAIERVRELNPDLVILDLRMPLVSGTTAAREIRRLSPHIKIVFFSMHDSETIIELTRLAGADACVSKQSSTHELHKAIAATLRAASRPHSSSRLPRLFDPT